MSNKQQTLNGSFSLFGKGLHTGLNLTVTFNPAPENHGYKIQRIDLPGEPIIDAIAENVTETTRGTVLTKKEARVSTVEHAMAALFALGVDNCLMQVNGPEFPILDGSAKYYVENIERVGIKEQNAERDTFIIKSKVEIRDEKTGNSIIVLPDEKFSLNVLVHYDSDILFNQYATLESMDDFKKEIASSRTFVFVRELEPLLSAGLIKGDGTVHDTVVGQRHSTVSARFCPHGYIGDAAGTVEQAVFTVQMQMDKISHGVLLRLVFFRDLKGCLSQLFESVIEPRLGNGRVMEGSKL